MPFFPNADAPNADWPFRGSEATWPFTTTLTWPFGTGDWPFQTPAVSTLFDDPLTADTYVTEREPNAAWQYSANGAKQPNTGGTNVASLSWGTKDSSQLLPDPTSIGDGKYVKFNVQQHDLTNVSTYPLTKLHVFADANQVQNVQDSFFVQADTTGTKLYRRIAGADTLLDSDPTIVTDDDVLSIKIAKNGSNWDITILINDVEQFTATAAHAGTLGRYAMIEYVGLSGCDGTYKNASATTDA